MPESLKDKTVKGITMEHRSFSMSDKLAPSSGNAGKKERSSNLELYRIIVMLAIVAHHYALNSGMNSMLTEELSCINKLYGKRQS